MSLRLAGLPNERLSQKKQNKTEKQTYKPNGL